jgi:hypothetical protein
MRLAAYVTAVLSMVAVAGPAFATDKGPTLQDKQQAACYDDVMRLCGNFVPDVDNVKACMKGKRRLVSAKCSAMWNVKH